MHGSHRGRLSDPVICRARISEADVLCNSSREQLVILHHCADQASKLTQPQFSDIPPPEDDPALRRLKQAEWQALSCHSQMAQ